MNSSLTPLVFFSLFLISPFIVYAHSGDVHAREIGEVFGLCDENSNNKGYAQAAELIGELGDSIAAFIDKDPYLVTKRINNRLADQLCTNTLAQRYFSQYKNQLIELSRELERIQRQLKMSPNVKQNAVIKRNIGKIVYEIAYIPGYQLDSEKLNSLLNSSSSNDILFMALSAVKKKIAHDQGTQISDFVKKIRTLAREEHLFKLIHGRHRVLFHWGFKNSPRTFPPLIYCVDHAVSEIKKMFPGVTQSEFFMLEEIIYDIICNEWEKRQQTAKSQFEDILYKYNRISPENMEQIRMLLEIAYNVHILGDYADVEITSLISVENLSDSLRECFSNFDSDDRTETRRICDAVTRACGSSNQKSQAAAAILSVLKKMLPVYLEHCPRMRMLLRGQ